MGICLFRRRAIASLGIALLSGGILFAKDSNESRFKGKWVLDRGASTATFDIPENLTQEIKPKGSDLNIITTWREPQNGIAPLGLLGVMTTQYQIGLNGQETTNYVGPFKVVSKTTENGNQLVTDWTAADQNGKTVTGHWTRSVSDDGRQMTLEIQEQENGGPSNNAKLVFRKK